MSTRLPRSRIVVSIAAILLAAFALVWTAVQSERQGSQIEALYAALGDEQSAAEQRGEEPVAPPPEDLIEDPEYDEPATPEPRGPTDAQVYEAVQAYFEAHPVTADGPSAAEIAAAVADYLAEFPPGPTAEQVSTAVAAYLTANPPAPGEDGQVGASGPPGPAGEQGAPGRAPTPEEIAAEVQDYMTEHPLPVCPEGAAPEAHTIVTAEGPVDAVICVAA